MKPALPPYPCDQPPPPNQPHSPPLPSPLLNYSGSPLNPSAIGLLSSPSFSARYSETFLFCHSRIVVYRSLLLRPPPAQSTPFPTPNSDLRYWPAASRFPPPPFLRATDLLLRRNPICLDVGNKFFQKGCPLLPSPNTARPHPSPFLNDRCISQVGFTPVGVLMATFLLIPPLFTREMVRFPVGPESLSRVWQTWTFRMKQTFWL